MCVSVGLDTEFAKSTLHVVFTTFNFFIIIFDCYQARRIM